jgi:hypothetical protein
VLRLYVHCPSFADLVPRGTGVSADLVGGQFRSFPWTFSGTNDCSDVKKVPKI